VDIEIHGASRAGRQLRAAADWPLSGPARVAVVLRQIAETVMTAAKRDYVPVATGALRASGFVEDATPLPTGAAISFGFGGPAAPYAAIVHENLTATHTVGQAKYLETPLRAHVQGMAAVLAQHAENAQRLAVARAATG
jgi:hypothetical protein